MLKPTSYKYSRVKLIGANTRLEFAGLEDFCAFADIHGISSILILLEGTEELATDFAMVYEQAVFQLPSLGYKTIEDYRLGIQNNFPNATAYYDATNSGYKKYEEYQIIKEAGIVNREQFEKIRQQGYVKGYDDFVELLKSGIRLPELPSINNASELFEFANKGGFNHYSKFKEAVLKGFTDDGIRKIATEHGFPDYYTYNQALKLGFRTYGNMEIAIKEKARDYADLLRIYELKWVGEDENSYDQRLLANLLSRIEPKKEVPLAKLQTVFLKTLNAYKYTDTDELPAWFTQEFNQLEALSDFLENNELALQYGFYNTKSKIFIINSMKERGLVIDGNNALYRGLSASEGTPEWGNILKLIEYLEQKGFEDITVAIDTALGERAEDVDNKEIIEDKVVLREAEKENPCETLVIGLVKRHHSLLVSNDPYRLLMIQDNWVNEYLDFYRLSYTFSEDGSEVTMPDLA